MANYNQQSLLLPIIIAIGKNGASMATEELYPVLSNMLFPWGDDLKSYANRKDTIFSQTVRNFTARERATNFTRKFFSYKLGKLGLTDFGNQVYNAVCCDGTNVKYSPSLPKIYTIHSSHPSLLLALRTKPFLLLAGISGTGKSRIVRELAFASCPSYLQDNDGTTPGNYCMIEVKPNWHDSTELLGYYSNISKKYIFTKFVKFLVKAKLYPDVPFFVCLDEMNLAPVEQYFAEYLSVLETRKKAVNEIKTGSLISSDWFTKSYENSDIFEELGLNKIGQEQSAMENEAAESKGQEISTEKYENQNIVDELKTYGLTLPDNVFVIGTVNMDDTTHQFSRKVIDRAMTIEMNGGELMDMFGGSAKLTYPADADVAKIDLFRPKYVNADEVLADHQDCAEEIKIQTTDWLKNINSCLKNTPFEVSYRVLNELVIYLGNLLDNAQYNGDGKNAEFKTLVNTAVDKITLMKILPRIEGDEEMFTIKNDSQNKLEKLQDLFKEIKSISSKSGNENKEGEIKEEDEDEQKVDDAKEEGDNGYGASEEKYCESYVKLGEMIERLENGFTRFWP